MLVFKSNDRANIPLKKLIPDTIKKSYHRIIIFQAGSRPTEVIIISKFLKRYSQAKRTSLFTSAATNQRGVSKGGSREAQVRFPEYQRAE